MKNTLLFFLVRLTIPVLSQETGCAGEGEPSDDDRRRAEDDDNTLTLPTSDPIYIPLTHTDRPKIALYWHCRNLNNFISCIFLYFFSNLISPPRVMEGVWGLL